MPCSNPRTAYLTADGKVSLSPRADIVAPLYLSCRRCALCLRERKQDVTTRAVLEGYAHSESICATFTFSPENLPPNGSLSKRDAQLLCKRIRMHVERANPGQRVRFHVVGEYSPQLMRPHLHVIVYGWRPADARAAQHKSKSGRDEFLSETLSNLWGLGRVTFQDFTASAAAYIAKHQASKLRHKQAAQLAIRDASGAVIGFREPEFELRPLRPGLGAGFFDKYRDQLLAHDFTIVEGRKVPLPKYFDTLAKRVDPDRISEIKAARALAAATPEQRENSTRERLAVREEVAKAKAAFFNRDGGIDVPY